MPSHALILAAALVGQAIPVTGPTDYLQAVEARQAGRPATATILLERWLEARPADLDARLQYGLALLDLGRLDAAERAFKQVLAAAPGYRDARLGLARIEERRGRRDQARAHLASLPPGDRDVADLLARLAAPPSLGWQGYVEGGIGAVDGPQPDWRLLAAQIRRKEDTTSYGLRLEATRRFGLSDTYGQVDVEHRFSPDFSAAVLAGGTPAANYRPRWLIGAGARVRVRRGQSPTMLTFDLRRAAFGMGKVTTLTSGLEQYAPGGKLWATGQLILLFEGGRSEAGGLVRLDAEVAPGLRLFGGAADAPDTAQGQVSRVRSLSGGAALPLGKTRVLRVTVARHRQDRGADWTDVNVGAGASF